MPLAGGPADKLGNRYELWWTVSQLVRMLQGAADAIRIEDPGVTKAEFVVQVGPRRELHQAKRSHPSGKWSIASMGGSDVLLLQAIGSQLAGNDDRFVFASSSDARELAELCERAAHAASAAEFESVFLDAEDPAARFAKLRTFWNSCDVPTAYEQLRRVEVNAIDERNLAQSVRWALQALFLANPDDVAAELRTVAEDSIQQTLSRDALVARLARRGFTLRAIQLETAGARVNEATNRYLDGVRKKLIRHSLLSRPATQALLAKLGAVAGDSVVTGRAGTGKTACVAEFVEALRARGVPVLAIRLDRIEPVSTTVDLGRRLDLDESPALVLAAAAEGREAVLVIDQLDAVSTTSGRATSFLEAVEGLLIEAWGLRARLPLHVVVVCRRFDWENDHRLRQLLPKEHIEVTVEEFSVDDVKGILSLEGFDVRLFEQRQLELLRLPQNLSLFLDAGFEATKAPNFDTATELFDRYWAEKRGTVAWRARPAPDRWADVIGILTREMTDTQQLSVPREKLDEIPPDYLHQMASEGVLTFDGRRYGFGHESFFDYCFARAFVASSGSLVAFLTSSEQHLFRRAQMRQVLVYLREADHARYCAELQALLRDPAVRTHIKDLALALLAGVSVPTVQEWAIWEPFLAQFLDSLKDGGAKSDKLAALAWQHFSWSSPWFRFADEGGLVARWLASDDAAVVNCAVSYLRAHQREAPDRVAAHLEPYVGASDEWRKRLRFVMEWADHGGSRRFFELFLRLVDDGTLDEARGPIAANSTFWSMLHGLDAAHPGWVAETLAHWLRRRLSLAKAAGEQVGRTGLFGNDSFAHEPFLKAARNDPAQFVKHVLPAVLEVSDASLYPKETPPRRDAVWPHVMKSAHLSPSAACLDGLAEALAVLAKDASVNLQGEIAELRCRNTFTANFLLLNLYAAGGARFADEVVQLLCEEQWRVECGYSDNSYWTTMRVIEATAPFCTPANRDALEKMILSYTSAWERTSNGYKSAGHARFNLLAALPSALRSTNANARFEELERKFGKPMPAPRGVRGGWVGPPIDTAAADKMKDWQWLLAIAKYDSAERLGGGDDFLKGGASQLAQLLETHVAKEPERFARLSLTFPKDTNHLYLAGVLRALQKAKILDTLKLEVCQKAYADWREPCGSEIADVLGSIEEPLPDDAVRMLDWLALEHPDPERESWQETAHGDVPYYGGDINMNGINTTRGRAAGAIRDLIFRDAQYLERFRATVDRLVTDRSICVLSCVGSTLQAVASRDVPRALALFMSINITDDRLLATPHAYDFIRIGLRDHFEQLRLCVQRMLRSSDAGVAEAGATLTGIAALHHESAADLASEAANGSPQQRRGLAKVAAANIAEDDCRVWCEERLVALFNDDDKEVRREAALCFRYLDGESLESFEGLIAAFCDSRAYQEDSFSILHLLENSLRRLPGITCVACEKFLDRFSSEATDIRTSRMGDARTVTTLIFRTYHQHQQDEWTSRSLNLIDRLCVEGFRDAREEFNEFER